jgi:hypothetical protein
VGGGATAVAAAAAAAVLALSTTSATPPAYAVTANHNDTVTLTISRSVSHADRDGVNRELAQLGVRARAVPFLQRCTFELDIALRYLQTSTQPWSIAPQVQHGPAGGWTQTIIPSRIPRGHTLVFAIRQLSHGWRMSEAIVAGRGPHCASPSSPAQAINR